MITSVPYLLSDTARLLRRAFDARVRQLGMTSTQARFLLILSRVEGENQGFYAERLEVEPITLCRLIDRMAEADLIERRADPADRRAWRIHLTARSRSVIDEVRASLTGLESEMTAGLSPRQCDDLVDMLDVIRSNFGAWSQRRTCRKWLNPTPRSTCPAMLPIRSPGVAGAGWY